MFPTKRLFTLLLPEFLLRRWRENKQLSHCETGGFESAEVKTREGRKATVGEFRQFNVASQTISHSGTFCVSLDFGNKPEQPTTAIAANDLPRRSIARHLFLQPHRGDPRKPRSR